MAGRKVKVGLVAQGHVAVGVVAIGGLAIGVVAIGGLAAGAVVLGGIVAGYNTTGAISLGALLAKVGIGGAGVALLLAPWRGRIRLALASHDRAEG